MHFTYPLALRSRDDGHERQGAGILTTQRAEQIACLFMCANGAASESSACARFGRLGGNGSSVSPALRIFNPRDDEFVGLRGELRDLYLAAYRSLPRYRYASEDKVDEYLDWLYTGDPRGLFVARSEMTATPVGFAVVHRSWEHNAPDVAELHELVVLPAWQRRGIGSELLRTAVSYAKRSGQRTLGLWVGEKNEAAIKMYRRFGFRAGRRWRFWLRMEFPLHEPLA